MHDPLSRPVMVFGCGSRRGRPLRAVDAHACWRVCVFHQILGFHRRLRVFFRENNAAAAHLKSNPRAGALAAWAGFRNVAAKL